MGKLGYRVYVLYSLHDDKLYVGFTTNLKQRLTDHFNGNSKATAFRRPFRLLFCEYYLSRRDAVRRERYLKTTAGKRALRIMCHDSLMEIGVTPEG